MIKDLRKFFRKECNYSEKIIFLVVQTRKFFSQKIQEELNGRIDIPYMYYADYLTRKEIKTIVREKRVDSCFKKCVKEMLKNGKKRELELYGVI